MKKLWTRSLLRLVGHETLNNDMYGHARVLRRYCGLQLPLPIQCLVQHGWSFGPGIELLIPEGGFLPKDNRMALWNSRNVAACRDLGYYNVRLIGAPLLYLPFPAELPNVEPETLLLFPSHSANSEPFAEDGAELFSRYIKELEPVTTSFKSTTICLYWREFEDAKIRRRLEDRGHTIATLGHRDRTPDFLERFLHLVLRHEYVSTNSFSTSLFYSLFLRRKAFVHGSAFVNRLKPGRVDSLTQNEVMKRRYPKLNWEEFDDCSHEDIGAEEIGAAHRREPADLRVDLGLTALPQLKHFCRRIQDFAQRTLGASRT